MKRTLLALSSIALFAGCASHPSPPTPTSIAPAPKAEPPPIAFVIRYVEAKTEAISALNADFGLAGAAQLLEPSRRERKAAAFRLGLVSDLPATLEALKRKGQARELKAETVFVREGQGFESRLELQALDKRVAEPPTASFSAIIAVFASAPGERRLKLRLSSFSVLALAAAGPRTMGNQIETEVVLRPGQSAIVDGLVASGRGVKYAADPEGGPLAELFKSKDFRRGRSRLLAIVTPGP